MAFHLYLSLASPLPVEPGCGWLWSLRCLSPSPLTTTPAAVGRTKLVRAGWRVVLDGVEVVL